MMKQATLNCCPLCHDDKPHFFFTDTKNYQHTYHRCLQCDLVFVIPECRLDNVVEKARYDMHHNDESAHYINFLSRLASPMLERLKPASQGLDFGSGKSRAMVDLFKQAGHSCQPYDIYYAPQHELLLRQYDFIVVSEVIEHLYDPKSVFEQWLTMLPSGGLLGIMTGLRIDDSDFSNWWYKNDPTHVMLFSPITMRYLEKQYRLRCVFQAKNVIIFSR